MGFLRNTVKRLFDLFFSLMALMVFAVPILFIALIIRLDSVGPVFFVQERMGKNGRPFRLIKFRTMTVAAGKSSGSFDAGDRSRVSRVGSFLRKTKLDELPQLINVIKGDMSLVGPRPEVKQWTEVYPEKWKIVLSVKPGITDNASIEFRNEEEILSRSEDPLKTYKDEILPRKLDLYIGYVNNQSFFSDLKILFRTFKAIIFE